MYVKAVPSSPAVSERMTRARRENTGPERALRSVLHRRGYRFRVHRPVPGAARRKVDIVFPVEKLAVFVDGCFWHACPEHATWPSANAAFWRRKLERNAERDRETDARLTASGWTVVRIWEHESVDEACDRVEETLRLLREKRLRV